MDAKSKETSNVDIFRALLESSSKKEKARREGLLKSMGVKDFFEDGSIKIDMRTCKGVECQFCIKVCPTKALYWKAGEIGITPDLCVHCASCVLNCMVDNCIEVRRRRQNGTNERFSNPRHVATMLDNISARNRMKVTQSLFPDEEAYLKRYHKTTVTEKPEK